MPVNAHVPEHLSVKNIYNNYYIFRLNVLYYIYYIFHLNVLAHVHYIYYYQWNVSNGKFHGSQIHAHHYLKLYLLLA